MDDDQTVRWLRRLKHKSAVDVVDDICNRQADAAAETIERLQRERDAFRNAVPFAIGAIEDAIYLDDGLDGDTGQRVVEILREAVEHGTFDRTAYGSLPRSHADVTLDAVRATLGMSADDEGSPVEAIERLQRELAGCSRSHPHENMGRMCELRARVAKAENERFHAIERAEKAERELAEFHDVQTALVGVLGQNGNDEDWAGCAERVLRERDEARAELENVNRLRRVSQVIDGAVVYYTVDIDDDPFVRRFRGSGITVRQALFLACLAKERAALGEEG